MASNSMLTNDFDKPANASLASVRDSSQNNSEHSETEERELVRKLDIRIMPIASLLFLFAFLDRSNVGNARLQGLPDDVLGGDKTGKLFDWVISAFLVSHIIFYVPFAIIFQLYSPRLWLAGCAIGWGTVSTLMATSFNFASLLTARVILGLFEAGFGPSMPMYFTFYYTKEEIGLRNALFVGFSVVAGAFGGLLAFGVQHIHSSIHNWRILFLIEGIPSVLLGIVIFFFLPERPESTTFLTAKERQIAIARMNRSTSSEKGASIQRAHIYAAFRDWRVYMAGVISFSVGNTLSALGAFLPTIIATFGFTNALAQLLTVPPYVVSTIILLSLSYVSDKFQRRGIIMYCTSIFGGIGYLILLTVADNNHVRYFATFCVVGGTHISVGLCVAWFAHNLGSESKKVTGIGIILGAGQCGGILGSRLFPITEGPRYIKGFAVSCALMFLASVCSMVLSISYRRDNARRNALYGRPDPNARVDTSELADKAHDFRYVT